MYYVSFQENLVVVKLEQEDLYDEDENKLVIVRIIGLKRYITKVITFRT